MPTISVTRLQLRSLRFFPAFLIYTIRSTRQVQRAAGFRAGWTGTEWPRGFWTATVWDSQERLRAFRNSPPHLNAMRKLLHWCDEASYAHWEQAASEPPDADTAFRRLREDGQVSKVHKPSTRQRAGGTAGDKRPSPGATLRPK